MSDYNLNPCTLKFLWIGVLAISSAKILICTSVHLTDTGMLPFAKNFSIRNEICLFFSSREANGNKHNVSRDIYADDTTLIVTGENHV